MRTGGAVVEVRAVTKRFGGVTALDDVSFDLAGHRIHGLLGRNGAGKTTLMQLLTGQDVPTSGRVQIFGETPYENQAALSRTCFVAEGQRYPDTYQVRHVLAAARNLYPRWDQALARELVSDFALPARRPVKKLSRGMRSALGVVVGLASRAELTLFDEPYLGLDAVARQKFYDRLLADYAEHPRTVIVSTHLIDEVGDLIEHVILVDEGRVLVDEDADALRAGAVVVSGPAASVDAFVTGRLQIHSEQLGGLRRATLRSMLGSDDRAEARTAGLTLEPVPLQQLIVRITTSDHDRGPADVARSADLQTEEAWR